MCVEGLPTRPNIPSRILRPETYKSRVLQQWQGRGPTYDSQDTFHQALAEALVERANILPASRVLDIATGTGMAALQAAKSVGLDGQVVGVDISDSMLAQVCHLYRRSFLVLCEGLSFSYHLAGHEQGHRSWAPSH